MSDILLSAPHLDWLTFTTFDPVTRDKLTALLEPGQGKPGKRMQYEGTSYQNNAGNLFCGQAKQWGKDHWLFQISGLRSQASWARYKPSADKLKVKVTRIDIAVTVDLAQQTWSQSALFARLRRFSGTRSISYIESKSGPGGRKLATIYFGQRTSDRMIRVYEKVLPDDAIGLRFEVEYKAGRAAEVDRMLCGGTPMGDFLRAELDRLDDPLLAALYYECVGNDPANAIVVKQETKTYRWLMDMVLPTLSRFLHEHGNEGHQLRDAYLRVLLKNWLDVTKNGD